jgi:hypothetical protein
MPESKQIPTPMLDEVAAEDLEAVSGGAVSEVVTVEGSTDHAAAP